MTTGERLSSTPEQLTDELMTIAGTMVTVSEGRVRIAHNEADTTTDAEQEAAHFLKLDEKRLGRDIELYGLRGRFGGNAQALGDFVGSVMLPLKADAPEVYAAIAPEVEHLGYRLIDAEHHHAWGAIFAESEN